MTTIGRTYHGPRGNMATACDYCGVSWHRSDLRLLANGLLACPDDQEGKTALELDQENGLGPPQILPTGRAPR